MLSLHCLSLKKPASGFMQYKGEGDVFCKKKGYPFYYSTSSSSSSSRFVCSVEKESQHFEVDPEKAREALKQLDQELQSLSQKQARSPKIKASDVKLTARGSDEATEEVTEFSPSFLAYTAGAFFLLTIFYNVIFITVIKPSIDVQDDEAPTTAIERVVTK